MTQDQEIKQVRDLVRTQSDIAGWLLLLLSIAGILTGKLEPLFDGFAFTLMSLVTLLGSDFIKGIRVSREGFEVGGRDGDQ